MTAPVITFEQMPIAEVSVHLSAFFEDPSRYQDPYALFRRLRELDPVHWSRHNTWVVTGLPEGRQLLQHAALSREASARQQFGPLANPATDPPDGVRAVEIFLASLINRDPPDHTRLRRLVSQAFSPRTLAAWQPRMDDLVNGLVDAVADRDEFDVVTELAYPLPETIICELLGVPVDDLRTLFPTRGGASVAASRVMTVRGDTAADGPTAPPTPDDMRLAAQRQIAQQVAYFEGIIEDRRRRPGSDLISVLAAAEEDGQRLTMDELLGTVIILIGAGHETTANLVANGMLALMRHPEVYARLRADNGLLPSVMEEMVRYATPSPGQPRTAIEAVHVGERTIGAGEQVFVVLNACNRDPRVFADPERFDIERPNNRDHITFTAGIHHCLGAVLARMEAGALVRAVAERLGPLSMAHDTVTWRPTYVRSLTALPVLHDRTGAQ